jgi:hypothetical protein
MLTRKETVNPELEDLLMRLARANLSEVTALEEFLENDPDVEMRLPLYNFIRKQYNTHTHQVRIAKLKQARSVEAGLNDLGLNQKQEQAKDKPTPAEIRNFIHDYEPLYRRIEAEELPYQREFCRETLKAAGWLEWNYYRGPKWTDPPGDIQFLVDISAMQDDSRIGESHKTKAKMIGRAFFKFLEQRGNANGGT